MITSRKADCVAMSLEPGDVIITGTPGGVGAARKPPVFMQYLRSGDRGDGRLEQLGPGRVKKARPRSLG